MIGIVRNDENKNMEITMEKTTLIVMKIVIISGADSGLLLQPTLRWRSSKRSRK